MILGRHTETGQPTRLVLGSGRPTLQHRKDPGPSTGLDRERANAAAEEDNRWRSSYERVIGRKLKGTQGVASLDRGIGAGLFPEARPRGTTPRVGNRFIVADGQEARGDTAAPPIVRRHKGSCYHSHPRLWHPIMAMNSGHCQRNRAHDGNMQRHEIRVR